MQNTLNQVKIDDLPATVYIDIPEPTSGPNILTWIGYFILIVGAIFIVFGPDTIYYNSVEGMTFVQYLQAYPGPIATAGGVIAALATSWSNSITKRINKAIDYAIDIKDKDVPDGYKLAMNKVAPHYYKVTLVKVEPVEVSPKDITTEQPN